MQVEKENPELTLDVFKYISTPNRVTMRLLLCKGCVNNNQLKIDLTKIFNQLYETPTECRTFHSILNSYVTCYLQSLNNGFKNSTWPVHSHSINRRSKVILLDNNYFITHKKPVENNSMLPKSKVSSMKSAIETTLDGLLPSNFHISHGMMLDNRHITKAVSLSIEIPAKLTATECDVSLSSKKTPDSYEQLSVVTDFQSFLSPLKEDYTKSSRGYSSQVNRNLLNNCNTPNMEDVDSDEFVLSDDECYDPAQGLIISRYLDSLNSSSSESKLSYEEFYCDSDSDESIVFSENAVQEIPSNYCRTECKVIEFDASFSFDSDGEDDNDDFGVFDSQFHKKSGEFSSSSVSLSQDKMYIYSTDFGGFFNPCFEGDDDAVLSTSQINIRNINSKWEDSMQDISCEPRTPKRVSFPPLPDLESVQIYEPEEDNYRYSLYVLDQLRFKNRIEEFEEIIKPYLSPHHRAKIYQLYNLSNNPPPYHDVN